MQRIFQNPNTDIAEQKMEKKNKKKKRKKKERKVLDMANFKSIN